MEQSEMEVELSETAKTDESCPQTTPSLPENSSGPDPSSTVEPSSQATLADTVAVPPDAPTNTQSASSNEEAPPAVTSDHSTDSQAVSSDQTSASKPLSSDEAVSSSAIPPHVAASSKVPPVPGPSSEASPSSVASKLTNGPASKKQRLDYTSMSTGVYLDSTVVPILHLALVTLDRLRPEDPVQYVIDFLLRHKAQYSKAKEHPAASASANQA